MNKNEPIEPERPAVSGAAQGSARLRRKYEQARKNYRRHGLFSHRGQKWQRVCRRIADKLGFDFHPFVPPPWQEGSTAKLTDAPGETSR